MSTFTRAEQSIDSSTTTARNADLPTLVTMLRERANRSVDLVVPATSITAHKGAFLVKGSTPQITEDGVTSIDGVYALSTVALEGIADRTGVPIRYLREVHAERPDLFSAIVNHHWRGGFSKDHVTHEPDARSFMLRTLTSPNGGPGLLRAVLSDKYKRIDDLEVATAILTGLQTAGIQDAKVTGDLTERRMMLRIEVPRIATEGKALVESYRSPYRAEGEQSPMIHAGLEVRTSSVGCGAFEIVPRIVIEACSNGLRVDALGKIREVHLGGRLEQGIVSWSDDTERKNMELLQAKTVDAVTTFLSPGFLQRAVVQANAKAGLEVANEKQVRDITKPLGVTNAEVDDLMAYFVAGGQTNRAGLANALTAMAQATADGDRAGDLEVAGAAVLGLV
jgi:hypothetical protein